MLYEQYRNYTRVAKECRMDRHTVKRIVTRYQKEGLKGLEDLSRRPRNSPNRTPEEIEKLVLDLRKKTNFGATRLAWVLAKYFGKRISSSGIKKILKRHGVCKPHKIKSKYGKKREVFYPDFLEPLQFFFTDTKDLKDIKTLPNEAYEIVKSGKVPRYQFTAIDPISRMQFISYGENKSMVNGVNFIFLLIAWLRTFGVMSRLFFQTDWGQEFGGTSLRKLASLNKFLENLNAEIIKIKRHTPVQNTFVERVHRTIDSEFYIPRLKEVQTTEHFIRMVHRWIAFYNLERPHMGKGMNGKSPFEKAKEFIPTLNQRVGLMPPIILDKLINDKLFTMHLSGENLRDLYKILCHLWNVLLM